MKKPVHVVSDRSFVSERPEQLLAHYGKTFHFATRFFPARYRQAVVTLYAFFRTLDDLVDERSDTWRSEVVQEELEAWRAWFQQGGVAPAPREPLGSSLATVQHTFQIPAFLFLDFLDGLCSDLEPREFQHIQELYQYCYQVAGTVGLAMAAVLGGRSAQAQAAAKDLGIAMQLTNILRDVGSDLADGRVYLPADELARFVLSPSALYALFQAGQGPDERFCELMRAQIQRARMFYRKGMHGIWLLSPNCRPPILLAGRLYQLILTEIERRQYDVFRERAATNLLIKVREAGMVFLLDWLWRGGEAALPSEMDVLYED